MASARIERLRDAVQVMHRVPATHVESLPIRHALDAQTAWEGIVEVFDLRGHPRAKRCYAWSYEVGPAAQFVTVLEIPPVDSAQNAVRASIVAAQPKAGIG
jgi:hypothetical protein